MQAFHRKGYADSLRAIGQALETLKVSTFALKRDGNNCVVQGEVRWRLGGDQPYGNGRSALPGVWIKLQRQARAQEPSSPSLELELSYSPSDIAQLEREGQARRRDRDGIPYPNSLPQLLRAVGTYLDGKGARLQALVRCKGRVTICYDFGRRRCYYEHLTGPRLHEISVGMYLRRTIPADNRVLH